jgi:hypothetical protein
MCMARWYQRLQWTTRRGAKNFKNGSVHVRSKGNRKRLRLGTTVITFHEKKTIPLLLVSSPGQWSGTRKCDTVENGTVRLRKSKYWRQLRDVSMFPKSTPINELPRMVQSNVHRQTTRNMLYESNYQAIAMPQSCHSYLLPPSLVISYFRHQGEAASTSETSVNVYQTTWRHNPDYGHLHVRRRENLKPHFVSCWFVWIIL